MTPTDFEVTFITTKTTAVNILGRSGCWLTPRIGDRIYQSRPACACEDIVLFAKQHEHHKELYAMCDLHGLQPLGIMLRADGRTRSGRGGHRGI